MIINIVREIRMISEIGIEIFRGQTSISLHKKKAAREGRPFLDQL